MSAAAFYLYQAQKLRGAYENKKLRKMIMKKIAIFALAATCNFGERAGDGASDMVARAWIFLNWTPMATGKSRRRR